MLMKCDSASSLYASKSGKFESKYPSLVNMSLEAENTARLQTVQLISPEPQ